MCTVQLSIWVVMHALNDKTQASLLTRDGNVNVLSTFSRRLFAILLQVGRTGMNMGADAEVYNLTELPTAAPAIWKLMTASASQTDGLEVAHSVSDPPTMNLHAAVCT